MRRLPATLVALATAATLLAAPAGAVDDLAPADLPDVSAAARTTNTARAAGDDLAPVLGEDTGAWMMVFKHDATSRQVDAAIHRAELLGGRVTQRWNHALTGFAVDADIAAARQLADLPGLAHIEANDRVEAFVTQQPATWGLDRIDQRDPPLDNSYTVRDDGNQVTAWIIDTGIRSTHTEFGSRVGPGHDTVGDGRGPQDCNGHGTHVAGIIGGVTWGVAQGITLRGVRALDCDGIGDELTIADALDHVAQNARLPAVVNLSLGGTRSATIESAVAGVVDAGVTVVVAAGNADGDACDVSPARMDQVITVAATTRNDSRASYSNWGSCIDVFAPGEAITSAWGATDSATKTLSGTSMAAPHVAGIAALALDADPTLTPAEVASLINQTASRGRVTNEMGSPDLLAYARLITDGRESPDGTRDQVDGCSQHAFVYTGTLSGSGDQLFFPPGSDYVTTEPRLQTGCTDGPDDADFDLYLVEWDGERYVSVAAGTSPSSDEIISTETPAGQYAWVVESHSGAGSFQFGFTIDDVPFEPAPCQLDHDSTGTITAAGQRQAVSTDFVLGVGDFTAACIGGTADADFNLHLQRKSGDNWVDVTSSTSTSSAEAAEKAVAEAGRYRWIVQGFAAGGDWEGTWRATPTTVITAAPNSDTDSTSIRFTSNDPEARFRCRLDGGSWSPCTSPHTYRALSEGRHTVRVRAVDTHGNIDPTPATATFLVNVPTGAELFVDVTTDNVFSRSIGRLAATGVTRGCNPPTNNRFCPADDVTRGQMAAFLVRALDLPPHATDMFTDDNTSIFEADIQALAAAGTTRGCNPPTNNRFCPADVVTRGQMAAFLVRALDLPAHSTDMFTDDNTSIFEADIQALAAAGITRGCNPPTNTRFCPDEPVTREQMSAFLDRAGVLG